MPRADQVDGVELRAGNGGREVLCWGTRPLVGPGLNRVHSSKGDEGMGTPCPKGSIHTAELRAVVT